MKSSSFLLNEGLKDPAACYAEAAGSAPAKVLFHCHR